MNAILINSTEKSVTVVEYDGKLKTAYRMLDTDCIKIAHFDNSGDAIFIDDDWIQNGKVNCFSIRGYPSPIIGNGLLVGPENVDGVGIDPKTSIYWVMDNILFMDLSTVAILQDLKVEL